MKEVVGGYGGDGGGAGENRRRCDGENGVVLLRGSRLRECSFSPLQKYQSFFRPAKQSIFLRWLYTYYYIN